MSEVLRGELGSISLAGLLQLLESESHTGWVGLGSRGGIALADGEVVQAAFESLTGRAAVVEWMMETKGPFRVERWDDVPPRPAVAPLFKLVMQGVRLLDEWSRLKHKVLDWAPDAETTAPLLQQLGFDGVQSLEQLVVRSKVARTLAVEAVLAGLEAKILRTVRTAAGAVSPASTSRTADYYQSMDQGRQFLAQGALQAAQGAFKSALVARPGDRLATLQLNRIRVLGSNNTER